MNFPSGWYRNWPGLATVLFLLAAGRAEAATYFVDPERGDDHASGTAVEHAWRSFANVDGAKLRPGDRVLLARGSRLEGQLYLAGAAGSAEKPIVISSYASSSDVAERPAVIDGHGTRAAMLLRNCSHVSVADLSLTADGGGFRKGDAKPGMRCGLLVEADAPGRFAGIELSGLRVRDVSFEEPGHRRPEEDVQTANGKTSYGWGIRFIVHSPKTQMLGIVVRDCVIERVDHTGLKFTAPNEGIQDVRVEHVRVANVGGPGIQLSGVVGGRFSQLEVDGSGSTSDTRNWGRGSGLWTWGCRDIVIERSRFTHANGPADSAGVHIDFNCRDVIVQYNFSANNAGGFCEILGDNHNCAYRYNVSVNDGARVKGRDGAFQEGKTFWLSGYVGAAPRTGPFNTYFYNNTIYVGDDIDPKLAVAPTAEGVLVANNIFYFKRPARWVAGDQSRPDQSAQKPIERVIFSHNLFLQAGGWPDGSGLASGPVIEGDPQFAGPLGGLHLEDYVPRDAALVKDRGIAIPFLPGDQIGLKAGLAVKTDVLGRAIGGAPDLGAIELP